MIYRENYNKLYQKKWILYSIIYFGSNVLNNLEHEFIWPKKCMKKCMKKNKYIVVYRNGLSFFSQIHIQLSSPYKIALYEIVSIQCSRKEIVYCVWNFNQLTLRSFLPSIFKLNTTHIHNLKGVSSFDRITVLFLNSFSF